MRTRASLDTFVTLTMRLNRTEEDLLRIGGALDALDRAHAIDARDEWGNNVLWGALMGARRVAAEENARRCGGRPPARCVSCSNAGRERINDMSDGRRRYTSL